MGKLQSVHRPPNLQTGFQSIITTCTTIANNNKNWVPHLTATATHLTQQPPELKFLSGCVKYT